MSDVESIRRATPGDRAAIRHLHRSLYQTHRDAVMPADMLPLFAYRDFGRVLDDDVVAMLATPNVVVLLAEEAGEPRGYITGQTETDPRRLHSRKGVVGDWFVEPEHRRKGTGRRLLAALERIFAEAGCEVIESATWPFNDATRRLHEKLGFAEVQIVYRRRTGA